MPETTLVYVLVFAFAVIALLALGARSFTALVELILSHGSKVDQLTQELQRVLTPLSQEKGPNTSSPPKEDTLTTLETPSGPSSESTEETK